jgi:hypothetical protein
MPIDASFHFVRKTADDYVLDAHQSHNEVTVSDLSDLGNLMVARTNGDPIVVIARHFYIAPDGSLGNEFTNAYIIGNRERYVAVNVCGTDKDKFYGVVPLLDFDRDYAMYLEAVDSCGALS